MPLWAIVGLLCAGIAVGFAEPNRVAPAFGNATLYVFLPALLFEAAWQLDAGLLRRHWRPIFALAVPGVAITTLVVGGALAATGFGTAASFLVGAIVSATDPISIVAVFRRLALPPGLVTIVEGEALFNDAMAVVAYQSLVIAAVTVVSPILLTRIVSFAFVSAAGGLAAGIAAAFAIGFAVVRRRGPVVQIVATSLGGYGAYYAADLLHVSGIFAVIAFAVTLRYIEGASIDVQTDAEVSRFWHITGIGANAMLFFLTGAAIYFPRIFHEPLTIFAVFLAIGCARMILAYIVTPLAMGSEGNSAWLAVVRAAGARGALSLALALAVPAQVAARPVIIEVTFAVVLVTVVATALRAPRIAQRFETNVRG